MPLKVGSNGLVTAAWQKTMVNRYRGYALAADGSTLKVDSYFGYDDDKVQREYQSRTRQPQTGVVTDADLHRLGIFPTLFSIHGTGQADPFGIGLPADAARECLDLFWWQPVGNYPATAVPMDGSVNDGEAELFRLINDRSICPGPFAMFDYSQGSIVGGRIRNRLRAGDPHPRYKDFIAAASWGNPMRPSGAYAGNTDPGGHGIDPQLELAEESYCINLAQRGDLYTTCPDGDVGEMERAIFNAVFRRWTGKDTVPEQLLELITNPGREIPALAKAIWNGGLFVARGTGPHVTYHLNECPGTGMTYWQYGIQHMRDVATKRLEALVAA
ncbi:hypothetical protein [Mycobacteroides abscessus]|uniref:hypothetical protein n=1 Tax=Mycobacteroides abscessus TaxID=36809 RepID=UPI0009A8A1D5|nr:hypothetical protein [Mycobacteroides abscessus]SKW05581.1 bacteriophage protein [Mycobacteroides abscessus subsp. abscessus]